MPRPAKVKNSSPATQANIGFEQKLWLMADMLRNNMDAAEYKHVVLGHAVTICDRFHGSLTSTLNGLNTTTQGIALGTVPMSWV